MPSYASTSGTASNVLVGLGTVSFKTPYTGSWTAQGFSIDGATLLYTPTYEVSRVPWSTFDADACLVGEEVMVVMEMAESTLANLRLALPGVEDLTASTITLGKSDYSWNGIGCKIVGSNPAGFARTITMPYGRMDVPVEQKYRLDSIRGVAIGFKVMTYPDISAGIKPFTIEDASS